MLLYKPPCHAVPIYVAATCDATSYTNIQDTPVSYMSDLLVGQCLSFPTPRTSKSRSQKVHIMNNTDHINTDHMIR